MTKPIICISVWRIRQMKNRHILFSNFKLAKLSLQCWFCYLHQFALSKDRQFNFRIYYVYRLSSAGWLVLYGTIRGMWYSALNQRTAAIAGEQENACSQFHTTERVGHLVPHHHTGNHHWWAATNGFVLCAEMASLFFPRVARGIMHYTHSQGAVTLVGLLIKKGCLLKQTEWTKDKQKIIINH